MSINNDTEITVPQITIDVLIEYFLKKRCW